MSRDAKFILLILLMALVHWWLLTQVRWPKGGPNSFAKKKETEIELSEVPPKNRRFVFSSKAKEEEEKKNEEAPFVGENRNRVDEETKSPITGPFREGHGAPQLEAQGEPSNPAEGLSLKELAELASSPDDLPKDISQGQETILNTDRMIFASFFARMYDQVYEAWVSALDEARMGMMAAQRDLESGDHITQLEVNLNLEGEVNSVRTLRSCGVHELDDACSRALWNSGPFQDPPKQMATEDGFIHFGFSCDAITSQLRVRL